MYEVVRGILRLVTVCAAFWALLWAVGLVEGWSRHLTKEGRRRIAAERAHATAVRRAREAVMIENERIIPIILAEQQRRMSDDSRE